MARRWTTFPSRREFTGKVSFTQNLWGFKRAQSQRCDLKVGATMKRVEGRARLGGEIFRLSGDWEHGIVSPPGNRDTTEFPDHDLRDGCTSARSAGK